MYEYNKNSFIKKEKYSIELKTDYCQIIFKNGVITKDDLLELIQDGNNLTDNVKMPFICFDESKTIGIDKSARDYIKLNNALPCAEELIFVTKNKLNIFIIKLLIKIYFTKHNSEIKLFSNENKAMIWLTNLIEERKSIMKVSVNEICDDI